MTRSKFLALAIVMVMVVAAVAVPSSTSAQDSPLRITLVINGVLGDKSFFDSAQRGMDRLIDEGYNVEVNTIELGIDPANWESGLSDAMADVDNYDVLIVGTFQMGEFLAKRVHLYPDKYFIFYDDSVPYDNPEYCAEGCTNVYSVQYAQNEGSFLAGVYAAAITTSGIEGVNEDAIIGVIGGQDIPVINDFIVGYEQGACLVNPDVDVIVQYAGGWNDPAKGKEITLAMYEQKADIVFQVAGGTGAGVIEAAKEKNFFAIGVDSDQDYMAPGNVLTSMLKRVDVAVYNTIEKGVNGELQGGTVLQYGLAEGGVGLSEMKYTRHIIPRAYLDQIAEFEQQILDGELQVVDIRTLDEDTFAIIDENPTCEGVEQLKAALAE